MTLLKVQYPDGTEREFNVDKFEYSQTRDVTPVVYSVGQDRFEELVPGDVVETISVTLSPMQDFAQVKVQPRGPSTSRFDILKANAK
jgi:hypothetical protein